MKSSVAFTSYNGDETGKKVQGRTTIDNYGATASWSLISIDSFSSW